MKKNDAVLFFKFLRIEHFKKDIGFIVSAFRKRGEVVSVSGFENESELKEDAFYLKGGYNRKFSFFLMFFYILSLRKKTERLILIHVTRENLLFSFLFCFFSNRKVYIKSDINIDSFLINGFSFWKKNKILDIFFKMLAKKYVDTISAETVYGVKLIKSFFDDKVKVFYLPNTSNFKKISQRGLGSKKNNVLFVGRLGCKHKNVELIFDALESLSFSNFHFDFVGPVLNGFDKEIERFKRNTSCSVKFHGAIYDEVKLRGFFYRAKFLLLSSKSEGFPLVFSEALSAGCVIISSDVYAAKDVVISDDYIFSDKHGLIKILKSIESLYTISLSESSLRKYDSFDRSRLESRLLEMV